MNARLPLTDDQAAILLAARRGTLVQLKDGRKDTLGLWRITDMPYRPDSRDRKLMFQRGYLTRLWRTSGGRRVPHYLAVLSDAGVRILTDEGRIDVAEKDT